jgi:hypothetical protein
MQTKSRGESSVGRLHYFTDYDFSWLDVRRTLDYHTSVTRSVCFFFETSLRFIIVIKPVWRFTEFQLLQLLCITWPRTIQVFALTAWNFKSLTPRSWALLEKPIVPLLVRNSSHFIGRRIFITICTGVSHRPLTLPLRGIPSSRSDAVSLRSILY